MGADHVPDESAWQRRAHPALRWVAAAETFVAGAAVLLIFALVLIQAGQRYLPVTGWAWTGELAEYCLVWLTFSIVGYLFGNGQHITLQVVDNLRSTRVQKAVRVFADAMVALIAIGFAAEAYDLVSTSRQVSPAMRMPIAWLYVIPLAGFVLTAVRAVLAIFAPGLDTSGGTAASDHRPETI